MTNPHPDPDDLAIAAAPGEDPDPATAAHLAGCEPCRRQVAEFRRTVEFAREGAAHLSQVDDAALARIRAAVLREAIGDATTVALRPAPPPRRRPWRVALAAVAAVVLVAVGVGIGVAVSDRPAPARTLAVLVPFGGQVQGGGAVTATGAADAGWTIEIHLTQVAQPPGSDYLEAWLMDAAGGDLVALGGLTRHGDDYDGTFTVPANLPMDRLRLVDVSAERFDGNPAHSGISLYRGTMA